MPTVDQQDLNRHEEVYIWGRYATFQIDTVVGFRRGRFIRFGAGQQEEQI